MKPNSNYVIDVKHLSKAFANNKAVDDISLQVSEGDIYGFVGPNGSGKTTTIRMLCGLLIPDHAEGTCLHYDILSQANEIKNQVGYMTQHFSLYEDLSVVENLNFVARIYNIINKQQAIDEIVEQFDFSDKRNQLAGTLSGGWKQRLALACALLHRPKLLLLDEPTAGVDPKARRDFWDVIYKQSQQGVTTLISTHYMDEIERCTHLAYISHGHILFKDSPDNIIQQANISTYEISGPGLIDLADKLQSMAGVDFVIPFGRVLHVSGQDKQQLKNSIHQATSTDQHWSEISPTLEDIIVDLISEQGA